MPSTDTRTSDTRPRWRSSCIIALPLLSSRTWVPTVQWIGFIGRHLQHVGTCVNSSVCCSHHLWMAQLPPGIPKLTLAQVCLQHPESPLEPLMNCDAVGHPHGLKERRQAGRRDDWQMDWAVKIRMMQRRREAMMRPCAPHGAGKRYTVAFHAHVLLVRTNCAVAPCCRHCHRVGLAHIGRWCM